jgi:hypothetical protein
MLFGRRRATQQDAEVELLESHAARTLARTERALAEHQRLATALSDTVTAVRRRPAR